MVTWLENMKTNSSAFTLTLTDDSGFVTLILFGPFYTYRTLLGYLRDDCCRNAILTSYGWVVGSAESMDNSQPTLKLKLRIGLSKSLH